MAKTTSSNQKISPLRQNIFISDKGQTFTDANFTQIGIMTELFCTFAQFLIHNIIYMKFSNARLSVKDCGKYIKFYTEKQ
jgi:hypothetical protein